MKYTVKNKQPNCKSCFVCGMKNESGLKASFYELENDELVAVFAPLEEHQSYPGRLHGGVASAILDETIGRAIMIKHPDEWGVTVELNIKYKKPIPLNETLRVVGRITRDSRMIYGGMGELLLENGDIAAVGKGKYLKMKIDKIADFDETEQEWRVVKLDQEPDEMEL